MTGRNILWTRTELALFEKYVDLDMECMMLAENYGGGVAVGGKVYYEMQELGNQLEVIRKQLRELMGATRYNIVVEAGYNGDYTKMNWDNYKKWENAVTLKWCRRHNLDPEYVMGPDLDDFI